MSITEEPSDGMFNWRLAAARGALKTDARRLVDFIGANRAVLASSARDIAASAGTSDAIVVRAVQALDFAGDWPA